jgi:endonuclease/exonuclease/phosphatase family metal-dependent hydrolase
VTILTLAFTHSHLSKRISDMTNRPLLWLAGSVSTVAATAALLSAHEGLAMYQTVTGLTVAQATGGGQAATPKESQPAAAQPGSGAGGGVSSDPPATPNPTDASLGPAAEPRFGWREPVARPKGAIRLASYNIENLFDDKDDPKYSGGAEDLDDYKIPQEREAAAKAIRAIDADILALQEVESRDALLEFRDGYLKDMGYEYVVSLDSGDNRGIENAVLSRFPLVGEQVWPDLPLGGTHPPKWGRDQNEFAGQPITFRRSPLQVTVNVPPMDDAKEYTLTLIVVHFKSGGPGGYWREREAIKTVELAAEITKADPNANVLICGDFNSQPHEKPVQSFISAGFIDAFADRVRDDPKYVTHESGRAIDQILLNANAQKEWLPESKFILGTPARPEGDWRQIPQPLNWASDHYPIVIDLVPSDR